MRCHVQLTYGGHEVSAIVGLVCTHGNASGVLLLLLVEHQQGGIALGIAIGVSGHRGGDQAVAILHQRMAEIAQPGLRAIALLVQPSIRIGGRLVRLVGALVAVEVRSVPAAGAVFAAEALVRCPGLSPHGRRPVRGDPDLDQRAVDGEVLVGHVLLRPLVDFGEEPLRHLGRQ
jgi:hypothetical protein